MIKNTNNKTNVNNKGRVDLYSVQKDLAGKLVNICVMCQLQMFHFSFLLFGISFIRPVQASESTYKLLTLEVWLGRSEVC